MLNSNDSQQRLKCRGSFNVVLSSLVNMAIATPLFRVCGLWRVVYVWVGWVVEGGRSPGGGCAAKEGMGLSCLLSLPFVRMRPEGFSLATRAQSRSVASRLARTCVGDGGETARLSATAQKKSSHEAALTTSLPSTQTIPHTHTTQAYSKRSSAREGWQRRRRRRCLTFAG